MIDQVQLKPEGLFTKLKNLQQVKKTLEEEVKEILVVQRAKKEEEDALNGDAMMQLELNHQREELVKHYGYKIQETKLKHRKIRMKFESQLHQLMEQHKNLSSVFTPQRLPKEIESAEYSTEQLQKAERMKLEQLTKQMDGLSHSQNTEPFLETTEKSP
ncbi:hypothetical protein DNTS_032514 [Danionella cerebrum]|uniref:Uncharacterized protein n=1 Tax=Danionella cerebrum TaxID=2873325 RepID=A0A553PZZ1_9TELE|nr:hypothetical protein DNTS_032514 [Danionella translucida]